MSESSPELGGGGGLRWPVRAWPQVLIAGQFAIDDREFSVPYFAPTHALLLHDYSGRVRIGDEEFEVAPGDLTLTPAGVLSAFALKHPGQHLSIHFSEQGRASGDRMTIPTHLSLGAWQQVATYKMMSIAELLSGRGAHPLSFPAASAALQELLIWIVLRHDELNTAAGGTRVEQAVDQAASILARDLGLECAIPRVAREVGLSQNYLARQFRTRFGMSMKHYLLLKRVETAQTLLRCTSMPLKAIASRVGVPDHQQFNKLMRRMTGMSPSAIRERAGRRQKEREK